MGWKNIKTGKIYTVSGQAINTTNDNDGDIMVLYTDDEGKETFAREISEFKRKFNYVKNKTK